MKAGNKRKSVKDTDWILRKKELYRNRGKADVPRDSKSVPTESLQDRGEQTSWPEMTANAYFFRVIHRYTARKRKPRF